MSWSGKLTLRYHFDGNRTVSHDSHEGPLRVLARLYPEAPSICHHVLVHPPGGVVGGDTLAVSIAVDDAAHALVTTPGATRFYRSAGASASQQVDVKVAGAARFEWLPLETLVYSGALAQNRFRFELAPCAEMIGWDLVALGLPASQLAFARGSYTQEIDLPGVWLERGRVDADDSLLLDSPLGWAGRRVMATMWFASGSDIAAGLRQGLLDDTLAATVGADAQVTAGATSPHARVVLLRVLSSRVEPAMQLLQSVWSNWRDRAWQLEACAPRVWRT